jgi:hypothetical protein
VFQEKEPRKNKKYCKLGEESKIEEDNGRDNSVAIEITSY